jgi:hypothetical protein
MHSAPPIYFVCEILACKINYGKAALQFRAFGKQERDIVLSAELNDGVPSIVAICKQSFHHYAN